MSDQSDIIWYPAQRQDDGTYKVEVDVANHKYHVGEYKIHAYLRDTMGNQKFVGATAITVRPVHGGCLIQDPSCNGVNITGDEKSFQVSILNPQMPGGVNRILFAVWSETQGQDDIRWYEAMKTSDGRYTYNVQIKNHKSLGSYNVHIYGVDKNQDMVFIDKTTFEVKNQATAELVSVSDINGTTGTFDVTISGIQAPAGISSVMVPVWCSGDQSDIMWYEAKKESDTVYKVRVNVSNHQRHFGNYKIHVYITMQNGIESRVGTAGCDISPENYLFSETITKTKKRVGIINPKATGNISSVLFPTWSNTNGQDDIIWYSGTKTGDNIWSIEVDSASHKHAGQYNTHVYVNGNEFAGGISYQLEKGFGNPCPSGKVSDQFGPRVAPTAGASTFHNGQDYEAGYGASILATESGRVSLVSYNSARGNFLIVDHGGGILSLYQHCSAIHVTVGQNVSRGQVIALVGSTGIVTGPHLHFEIHENGAPVDPRKYL